MPQQLTLLTDRSETIALGPGATALCGFALPVAAELIETIDSIAARAPFRHMITPGGFRMSAAMTNCGEAGWITDRRGYRYGSSDPETSELWPEMPAIFLDLAARAAASAGYKRFRPDACLMNQYAPGSRLTLHQDKNEQDFRQPIVSVSLGLPAIFLFGGLNRSDRPQRIKLEHGDVAVWGGLSRLFFHGIDTLTDGEHPATGSLRYNLTFRRAL
jgi:alkylated DNA repair protein (DNA oxidative demethylase)